MRSRRVLESYLLLGEQDIFMVGFRFLWENRTTSGREFLEFGRQICWHEPRCVALVAHIYHITHQQPSWLVSQGRLLNES